MPVNAGNNIENIPALDPAVARVHTGEEMEDRIREMDWAKTPLGPIEYLAPESSHRSQHPAFLALRHVDGVGSRADHVLQRCLSAHARHQTSQRIGNAGK